MSDKNETQTTTITPVLTTEGNTTQDKDSKSVTAKDTSQDQRADDSENANVNSGDGEEDNSNSSENEKDTEKDPKIDDKSAEKASSSTSNVNAGSAQTEWQAVYSPPHNAYYFYHTKTGETTWSNPLEPQSSASSSQQPQQPPQAQAQAQVPSQSIQPQIPSQTSTSNPALDGIDPELAFLDPTLAYGSKSSLPNAYTARFNARTGRFTASDGRDPSHVSEYERARRMGQVFFDVDAWESDVAKRKAEEAAEGDEERRRKRPSKADMERYKLQKEAKKKTKYAWLRE